MSTAQPQSAAAIFERAVELAGGIDPEAGFELIGEMLEQRDRAYEVAVWRLRSGNEIERVLAVHILGILSADPPADGPDIPARILEVAKKERDEAVQRAIASALRYSNDPRAIPLLSRYASSGDATLRRAAVESLGGCIERSGGTEGVDVLIAATRDHIDEIRNWATFELGLVVSRDDSRIRDALFDRLTPDESPETWRQAVAGLSRRRDQRMIPILLAILDSGEVSPYEVRAASYLRSKQLLPALIALREWWDVDPELLEHAIELCDIRVEARNFAKYEKFRAELEKRLSVMLPGVHVTLACDLSIESGPVVVVADNFEIDISYPTVPVILAMQRDDIHSAAMTFSEAVLRDYRHGRRQGRRY